MKVAYFRVNGDNSYAVFLLASPSASKFTAKTSEDISNASKTRADSCFIVLPGKLL